MEAVREIIARGVPLDRSDVDTDQIIPSDWLKRVERTGFGAGLFSEWRERSDFILNQSRYDGAHILVTGPNFGTGSSREHAPWALQDYGFQAIISPRFADIFKNNCTKNGLLPVELEASEVEAVAEAGHAQVDLAAQEVRWEGGSAHFDIDPEVKHRLLNGLDDISLTLQQEEKISAYEADRERSGPVTTALS